MADVLQYHLVISNGQDITFDVDQNPEVEHSTNFPDGGIGFFASATSSSIYTNIPYNISINQLVGLGEGGLQVFDSNLSVEVGSISYPTFYSININEGTSGALAEGSATSPTLLPGTFMGNEQIGPNFYPATLTVTDISAPCFCPGTLIRTARGEVVVERLAPGDLAVTASGQLRPIAWTGHRTLDGYGRTLPHDQQPIRIRAGAFGDGVPARDLWLSPGHPVLVGADADGAGGVLVPVMCLINGTTVARQPVQAVTYWHVELDQYDILLAEGLPAESFLDYGNRDWFGQGAEHALLNPDHVAPGLGARCRPVATDGPLVEAERRRLDQVFATALAAQCAWPEVEQAFGLA